MKKYGLLVMTVLAGMGITPAQANTFTFGWVTAANSNTDLGSVYSLANNGITLTAHALTAPANLTTAATAGPNLYAKNSGVGETGLGIVTDPGGDHEISAQLHDGIQVDFSDALNKAPNATVNLMISSSQVGEGWALYGSNTLLTVVGASKTHGMLGEPLASGSAAYPKSTTNITLPDWGQFSYYTLMATNADGCSPLANVILGTVTLTTPTDQQTPEPGTMVMAGIAMLALGVVLKKRNAKA